LRTIVRTHPFEERLRQLLKTGTRGADEFIEGAEWALARRATIGTQITTGPTQVWILPIVEQVSRLDPVVLYYTFDADNVYLIWIDLAKRTDN
jgi:hypothetical protein